MLKFLIDHNVPRSVGLSLKRKGYNVKLVKTIDPEMSDRQIVRLALNENRIVLSNDKDFIHLASKYKQVNLILFDYRNQGAELRVGGLNMILPKLNSF